MFFFGLPHSVRLNSRLPQALQCQEIIIVYYQKSKNCRKMSTDSPPKTVAYFLDPDVGSFHYGSSNILIFAY